MRWATFIKSAWCDRDCRRWRPYPPLHLGQILQWGERETHCSPWVWRGDSTAQRTARACTYVLWGALCITHVRRVDVTTQAAKCSIETLSIPELASESNVVVQLKNSEVEVDERRDATLLPLHSAHQETWDHPDRHGGSGKWGRWGRGRCVDGRQRAIPWMHHNRPVPRGLNTKGRQERVSDLK